MRNCLNFYTFHDSQSAKITTISDLGNSEILIASQLF